MDNSLSIFDAWLLALTLAAAVIDTRSGLIPNWLTLPTLALAPLAHAALAGPGALGGSLAGALLCAAIPVALWMRAAIGGGDVKLLAAIGTLLGAREGLELQLRSYVVLALFAVGWLALRGKLRATLCRSLGLLARMLRLRGHAALAYAQPSTELRFGAAIFAASAAAVVERRLGL